MPNEIATLQETSTTKTRIEAENDNLFWEIIRAYRRFGPSQPLVSSNPNPYERRKMRTGAVADFLIDVESATRFALQGTGLLYDWQRLANEDKWPESRVRQRIIRLCANVYRKRGLQPDCYFTGSGRGSEPPARKSALRTPTRVLCKEHDLQPVTHRLAKPDGDMMRLGCGCHRREGV